MKRFYDYDLDKNAKANEWISTRHTYRHRKVTIIQRKLGLEMKWKHTFPVTFLFSTGRIAG